MERDTGTILKIRLLDKTYPGKQEGVLQVWKHKGKLVRGSDKKPIHQHFDQLGQIPAMIRTLLERAEIEWPKQ
jgi:hypothetical protein